MMTEKQARTTQCCVAGCGIVYTGDPTHYCAASSCMGWRWATIISLPYNEETMTSAVARIPDNKFGYCGRAGKDDCE